MVINTHPTRLIGGLLLGLLWLPWQIVQAHDPGISYARIMPDSAGLSLMLSFNATELERFVGLDADADATISAAEVAAAAPRLRVFAAGLVQLDLADAVLKPTATQVSLGAQQTIELGLRFDIGLLQSEATLAFLRLDEFAPDHRLYVAREQGGELLDARILSAYSPRVPLPAQAAPVSQILRTYIAEGVHHIWQGFDHLLFLITLLLPAVLVRVQGRWLPASGLRPAAVELLKVVTAFTLAHSITLSLSVLNVVTLPSRAVESLIALSVILAAVNNLLPLSQGLRWPLAFGFGLLHGFGFASVLALLGLPVTGRLVALAGFNLGIELGQLLLVAIVFPVLYRWRARPLFRPLVVQGGSLLVMLVAGVWLWQRALPGVGLS